MGKPNPYENFWHDPPPAGMSVYEADDIQSRNRKVIFGMGDSSEDQEKCLHENRVSSPSYVNGVKVVHNRCMICKVEWDKRAS